MSKRAGYKKLDKNEYNNIKQIANNTTLSGSKLAKIINRSAATVSHIKSSKDYEDYRKIVSTSSGNKPKNVIKKVTPTDTKTEGTPDNSTDKVSVVPSESVCQQNQRILRELVHQTNALNRQAEAMERLADAWEAQPNKKGLFR